MVADNIFYYDENPEITGRITFKNDYIFRFFKPNINICVLFVEYTFERQSINRYGKIIKKTSYCDSRRAKLADLLNKKLIWLVEYCNFEEISQGVVLKTSPSIHSKYTSFVELLTENQYKRIREDERLI